MKIKNNNKRKIIQWIALGIVLLSTVIRLVLVVSGVGQNIAYSTQTAIMWIGYGIGIILLLISYLFPKKP